MTPFTPFVLQFINTSADIKDYYYLTSTTSSYQLRHYLPNDDGVFNPECCVNEHGQYIEKVIEMPKHQTSDIRFLEDTINDGTNDTKTRLHSKVHVFLSPEFTIKGKYTRFIFHHCQPPTNEANKFVGVLLYAHVDNESPKNTQQMLLLFKKNHNSIQSYEEIGKFDPNNDELPYMYIEKFMADGNVVDIYYYGERKPAGVHEKLNPLLRTMPLAIFLTNREVCDTHKDYQKSCIMCVRADIMSAPRQLTIGSHTKKKNSNVKKYATNNFSGNKRNYRRHNGN